MFCIMPLIDDDLDEISYDPVGVKAVIHNAYRIAEDVGRYREEVEEAIGMVESLPYSVIDDGLYTEEELVESGNGISMLENIQAAIRGNGLGNTSKEDLENIRAVRLIEETLEQEAFRPSMQEGKLESFNKAK